MNDKTDASNYQNEREQRPPVKPDLSDRPQNTTRGAPIQKPGEFDREIARYTKALAWLTGVLAIATTALGWYAAQQAKDVKETIQLARQTMIGDQRPWIGGPEATFRNGRATFVFTNTGKTPATGIYVTGKFSIAGYEASTLDEVCTEADRKGPPRGGFGTEAITPNGKYVLHDLAPGNTFSGPDALPYLNGNKFVVGCVFYGIPFDKKLHRTGFSIPIDKAEDGAISFGEASTLFPD